MFEIRERRKLAMSVNIFLIVDARARRDERRVDAAGSQVPLICASRLVKKSKSAMVLDEQDSRFAARPPETTPLAIKSYAQRSLKRSGSMISRN